MLMAPGQAFSLQGRPSVASSSVHLTLPYHACLTGSRVRDCIPPPHAASHSAHAPQFEYSQSTVRKIVNNDVLNTNNKVSGDHILAAHRRHIAHITCRINILICRLQN